MAIIFDVSEFFEYYRHMKARGRAVVSFKKALKNFRVKEAMEDVGRRGTSGTVYLVPSVTGNRGLISLGGKLYYEY